MAVATGTAILAGGALAAGGSLAAGYLGSKGASSAANKQLQGTQDSIAAQERLANKGFGILQSESERARQFMEQQNNLARADLEPLRALGLASLQRASGYADPNSAETQAERAAYQKVLAQNLSARGLTGSGTEIAGLSDFELGLARERRNIGLGLAGMGSNTLQSLANLRGSLGQSVGGIYSNLGAQGAGLFGNLGQGIGSTLTNSGNALANLQMAKTQALMGGFTGVGNAAQSTLLGLGQLNAQQENRAYQDQQLKMILGSLGGNRAG